MFKTVFLIICAMAMVCMPAIAALDSNVNTNGQNQDQLQGQAQGQLQGQAQGQGQGQSAKTGDVTNNEGKEKTLVIAASNSTPAAPGTESIASFLLGWSKTSEYVGDDAFFKDALAANDADYTKLALDRMAWSTRPNRLFGCLYKTRGISPVNLFGLASWPSWLSKDDKMAK